jgi:hypothetical protein
MSLRASFHKLLLICSVDDNSTYLGKSWESGTRISVKKKFRRIAQERLGDEDVRGTLWSIQMSFLGKFSKNERTLQVHTGCHDSLA